MAVQNCPSRVSINVCSCFPPIPEKRWIPCCISAICTVFDCVRALWRLLSVPEAKRFEWSESRFESEWICQEILFAFLTNKFAKQKKKKTKRKKMTKETDKTQRKAANIFLYHQCGSIWAAVPCVIICRVTKKATCEWCRNMCSWSHFQFGEGNLALNKFDATFWDLWKSDIKRKNNNEHFLFHEPNL